MLRHVTFVLAVVLLSSCSDDGPSLPAAQEACGEAGECAAGLSCVHLICADDRGPQLKLVLPEQLQVFEGEVNSLSASVSIDELVDGAQVQLTLDPGDGGAQVWMLDPGGTSSANGTLDLSTPLAVGPHHLRARLLDADGQPHPNPSASDEVLLFMRDPDIPTTPQIAIVWPPTGYEHRIGNPLEIEVAVLPGSFTFAEDGDVCQPLPDCEPAFAPECEDTCGPVTRSGHAKILMDDNFPACLQDMPLGCFLNYILSMRPGQDYVELIDDYDMRSVLPADRFLEPGTVDLHGVLSTHYHQPYPHAAGIIYETITLSVVE